MLCCGKKSKKKKVNGESVVSHDNNAFVANESIKGDEFSRGGGTDEVKTSPVVKEVVMGDGGMGKNCEVYSRLAEEGKAAKLKSILQKNDEVNVRPRKESTGGRRRSVSFHLPDDEGPIFTKEQLEIMFEKADKAVEIEEEKEIVLEKKVKRETDIAHNSLEISLTDGELSESDDETLTEDHSATMSNTVPTLTKPAPIFKGTAVVDGQFKEISLEDYSGKYVVFFFYPLDFTFVCPTEIIAFSDRVEEFRSINCEVVACSTDSHFSHLAWMNMPRKEGGLGPMNIPLLADKNMEVAKAYGVLKEDEGIAFRGLFIIDGAGKLRQATMNDLPVGRDVDETLRLVQAFQFTDEHGEVCPAGWRPGGKTMKADPVGSKEYFGSKN